MMLVGMGDLSNPMRILISGANGLVGSALQRTWSGHSIVKLVRHGNDGAQNEIVWSPETGISAPDQDTEGFDAVVHLAGEPVFGLWSKSKKERIRNSRVEGTKTLAQWLADCERKPRVFVCASAVGYYGARGDEILSESSAAGTGFLADVVREWEAAAQPTRDAGVRTVHLRIGVVLSQHGGALKMMLPAFRAGLGGTLGDGKHWMSWITLDDLVRIIEFAVSNEGIMGVLNTVAPNPVTNAEFTRTLGKALHRPTVLPIPAFVLRSLFGQFAEETLLTSERVIPEKLLQARFKFDHADLEKAWMSVLA